MPERVRHTLNQVSTATALVEGIYEGAVQVSTLQNHGDLGLGSFEGLDGEMVIVDGHFFQVRGDGSVREVRDNVLSPFAAVTAFSVDQAMSLDYCPDLSHLTSKFDALRSSDNFVYPLRVDGTFDYIHARAMRRTNEGVPLVQAAAVQPEFEFQNISGTLVGFWSPEYAKNPPFTQSAYPPYLLPSYSKSAASRDVFPKLIWKDQRYAISNWQLAKARETPYGYGTDQGTLRLRGASYGDR